jgi:hypothetical protein
MEAFLDSLSKSTVETALHISEVILLVSGLVLLIGIWGEYRKDEKWEKWLAVFQIMVLAGKVGGKPGIASFSRFRLKNVDVKHGREMVRPG